MLGVLVVGLESHVKHTMPSGGAVREIMWEYKYGMLVCEVEINNNGRKYEIKFNAATGEIIEID